MRQADGQEDRARLIKLAGLQRDLRLDQPVLSLHGVAGSSGRVELMHREKESIIATTALAL